MNVSKGPTNKLALLKGKAISTSTPSFSIRYHAEDEEIEQLYDTPKVGEVHSDNSSPQLTPVAEKKNKELNKSGKRSGSLEEAGSPEPWRLFTEIRGRITKTVEEKIEEINRKKKKKEKLRTHSSLSDSEEKSEPSLFDSSSPEKSVSELITTTEKLEETAESDLGDVSDTEISLNSDRATTPTAMEVSNILPGLETKLEKRKISAVFRNRQKVKHRRKASKSDKIELAVEALEEEKNTENIDTTAKSQAILYRKKIASSIIIAVFVATLALSNEIPSFLTGILIGMSTCLASVLWTDYLFKWIFETKPEFLYLNGYYKYSNLPLLSDNMISLKTEKLEERLYTGWMNEFPNEYRPDIYHVSQTETVYVKLIGSSLKLCSPKGKIPKRSLWNERQHKIVIDMERTYDINNCSVRLLPEGLVQKRLWSKKYPICINLLPNSHRGTKFHDGTADETPPKGSPAPSPKDSPVRENLNTPEEEELKLDSDLIKNATLGTEESNEDDEVDEEDFKDYVQISPSVANKNNIYLFARTDREKDLWFRRLVAAAGYKSWPEETSENNKEAEEKIKIDVAERIKLHEDYFKFMKQMGNMKIHEDNSSENSDANFLWLNLFIGRVLYDPMKNPYWVGLLQDKISRKLSVIKVPSFMERFNLSKIEFTKTVPTLEKSHKPKLNDDGLWVELDISYQGICKMTIDTKINLIKLKLIASRDPDYIANRETDKNKSAYLDSSQEDSAETSCEENDDPKKSVKPNKALMVIDKIAASKMFQQVTDNSFVKKAMENVSNMTLSLSVEVRSLVGTVVLNIPPPPSDRLWYGFKSNTKLELSAKPRVGDHGINMGYITGLIEKKLYQEFQKLLFMPNMDDLPIAIMTRDKPF